MDHNSLIKGLIFDLDGVILFTDKYHYLAWKKLADELNIPFNEETNEQLRGVSRKESLEIILKASNENYSNEQKEILAERKNKYYVELLANLLPSSVSSNVRKTLTTLKNKGYKLAIGSSSKNTKLILKKVGMLEMFDAISDGTNIINSKPDPEVFLKAAEMIDVIPSNAMVIEDALAGIEAANAGGFISVGIGPMAKSKLANIRIKKISDLLIVLKENN